MLPEHTAGPAVNGVDGRFVHPLRSLFKAGCMLLVVVGAKGCLKLQQKIIGILHLAAEELRSLG